MKLPKDQLAETNDLNPILTEMEASLNDLREEIAVRITNTFSSNNLSDLAGFDLVLSTT